MSDLRKELEDNKRSLRKLIYGATTRLEELQERLLPTTTLSEAGPLLDQMQSYWIERSFNRTKLVEVRRRLCEMNEDDYLATFAAHHQARPSDDSTR